MEGVRNVFKVSGLNKSVKERAYQVGLRGKYEVLRCGEVERVKKEWKKFGDIVKYTSNDVCGMRRVGELRRNWSEFWRKEVGVAVAVMRKPFEE